MCLASCRRLEGKSSYSCYSGWDFSLFDEQQRSNLGTPYVYFSGDGALDPLDEHLVPARKLVCLGMSKLGRRRRIQPVEGLLLLRSQSDDGFSRRIGFFRIAASFFDGVSTSIFRNE
jgi:hypothetical protein